MKTSNRVGIRTCSDYSPFGVELDGRTVNGGYRYGYNRHEKDDEISGYGNHLSWGNFGIEPRIGFRWQIDPQAQKLQGQSPYIVNNNNPNSVTDPDGEFGFLGAIIGAAVGTFVEYGSQATSNIIQGKSLKESFFSGIDFADVAISAAEGAVTGATAGVSLIVTKSIAGGLRASIDLSQKDGLKTIGGIIGYKKRKSDVAKDITSEVIYFGFSHGLGKLNIESKVVNSFVKSGSPIKKIIKAQIAGQFTQGYFESTGTGILDGLIHNKQKGNPFRLFEDLDVRYLELHEIKVYYKKTNKGTEFNSEEAEKLINVESQK